MKRMRMVAAAVLLTGVLGVFAAHAETKPLGFTFGENRYETGMDAEEAKKTLGKEKSERDVNSCANGYVNKAYTYGENDKDFEVYVELDEKSGKDIVAGITLLTGNVATEEGLKVGDTEAEVQKIYPDAKKGLGSYKMEKDGKQLYVRVKSGKVSYISYTAAEQK